MPSPVFNHDLFQKLLAHGGLGMAYMHPEYPKEREIEIGDVGVFQESGRFLVFFNVFRQALPELDNYTPCVLPQILSKATSGTPHLQPGHLTSANIYPSPQDMSTNPFTLEVPDRSSAAFVINQTAAIQSLIAENNAMADYMLTNRQSWYDYATKTLQMKHLHKDDIVFISGHVKTATWILGLVGPGQAPSGTRFTIGGVRSDNPQELMVGVVGGQAMVRSGPDSKDIRLANLKKINEVSDQCIFLSYYKAKTRWIGRSKIEANAGPDELPPDNDDEDNVGGSPQAMEETITIEHTPATHSPVSPLDPALDYILKYNDECEVAITSDIAVYEMMNGLWPEDMETLEQYMPNIFVSENQSYGMFSIQESVLRKYQQRSLEQREEFEAEQIEFAAEGEAGPSTTTASEDRWRYCTIVQGKVESGIFEWPHVKLGEPNEQVAAALSSSAVSPDGVLVAGGYEDGTVHVWRMDTGMLNFRFTDHESEDVQCMAFSPNSHELAAGATGGKMIVWNMHTGAPREIPAHDTDVWCLAYAPNGKTMATGSADCSVKLWDTDTYTERFILANHPSVVQAISFSPDSTLLVSASQDYGKVWDVSNGNLVSALEGHENVIWTLSFSPDSLRIITGSEDNTARIWDAQNGDELVTIREHTSPVWAAQFSNNGREVMTGSYDSTVSICDSYVGTQRQQLRHVASTITTGCYSPNGEFVVAGYAEGSINVWSTKNGPLVADLKGHEDKVKTVIVTSDNKHIVSASEDGSVRIWSIEDICRLATAF